MMLLEMRRAGIGRDEIRGPSTELESENQTKTKSPDRRSFFDVDFLEISDDVQVRQNGRYSLAIAAHIAF
jgi:hypothetical protein